MAAAREGPAAYAVAAHGTGGVGVGVEDGRGPGAADPAGRLDLAAETGAELLVQREMRVHDLHGDRAPSGAAAQIDPAHPAGAQPAEQPVGADRGGFVGCERLHGVFPPPYTGGTHRRTPTPGAGRRVPRPWGRPSAAPAASPAG
ncbi:hypothetical protein GCM10020256_31390 [Streptomyces thermocoprophilus]